MGCDIHSAIEVKKDGRWQAATKFTQEDGRWDTDWKQEPIKDRNYRLFGMLANVRNGYGFAGVVTGDALVPIHEPRGVDPESSREFQSWVESWGFDGHSHSWATLQELLDYDLTRTVTQTGILSIGAFFKWDGYWREQGEQPDSWSGGISGPGIEVVSEARARDMIQEERDRLLREGWTSTSAERTLRTKLGEDVNRVHVECNWVQYYWQLAGELTHRTIPLLLGAAREHGVGFDDVRVVYFFDN